MNTITGTTKQTGRKYAKALSDSIIGVMTSNTYNWKGVYKNNVIYNANDVVLVCINGIPKLVYALGTTGGEYDSTRWADLVITVNGSGGAATVYTEVITIPNTGWVSDGIDNNGYEYYLDIQNPNVVASATPSLTIHPDYMSIADECGFNSACQALDGVLRVFSNGIPSDEITATIALFGVSAGTVTIVIPTDTWVEDPTPANEDRNGYNYYCDIYNSNIQSAHTPLLTILPEYIEEAMESGILSFCETYDGYVRVFTTDIPKESITASLALFNTGTSSGGINPSALPIASKTTLGVIKLGDGLVIEDDGTVNIDIDDATVQKEIEDFVADDNDADEVVNEIFGPEKKD